jgi:transposase-like protein
MTDELRKVLKRLHYPLEIMLVCARRYAAYPLSLRHIEEMMQERGVFVDHATAHRWALKILPVLALVLRRRKRPVGTSWRLDETFIKVAGQWKYLYRAVDKTGDTVDFLLTAKRDKGAAQRYLERTINLHGLPEKNTIEKVEQTPLLSIASMRTAALISDCANRNTSTTSSSQVIEADIMAKIAPTGLSGINLRGVFRFPV